MRHYLFNIENENGNSCTVVFDYSKTFSKSFLRDDLLEFHTHNSPCIEVIFVQPSIRNSNDYIVSCLCEIFNLEGSQVQVLTYHHSGFDKEDSQKLISKIKYYGLLNIIKERSAILEGDDLFHYVLPSGKHSPFFIRTANTLQKDFEIFFIAFCLLDELNGSEIRHIACDTSSIISIGYALIHLWGLFDKGKRTAIQSFESYNKVEKYNFKARSLILISATNSGGLEKEIYKTSHEEDIEIITVIYNNKKPLGRHLINIDKEFTNLLNRSNRKQFKEGNCDYCDNNSTPVIVSGEQFIPSKVITQKCLLWKEHVPNQIIKTMDVLGCSESIICFKSENLTSKKREIFIDFKSLKESQTRQGELFERVLKRLFQNNVPSSVSHIIYLNDESSKLVADSIYQTLTARGLKIVEPIPHNKMSVLEEEKDDLNTILVISSCLTSGNKLNSVSRSLRNFKNSSIHYITLLSRLSTKYRKDVLKGNLEYRKDRNDHCNVFTTALECYLGDSHDQLNTNFMQPPWCEELRFWHQFDHKSLPTYFQDRVKLLESNSGLVKNLFFYNSMNGSELELRANFALYDLEEGDKISQADVYFIFSGIFHYLRNPKNEPKKKLSKGNNFLIQHEHVRTIIDPECFDRFNDGVTQSCILRLSRASEMAYIKEEDSIEIKNKLIDLFKDSQAVDDNESLLEFLYAIATKKMRFLPNHLREFCDHINAKFSDINEVDFFLRYIRDNQIKSIVFHQKPL